MADFMLDAIVVPGETPNDPCLILLLHKRLRALIYRNQVVLSNANEQSLFGQKLERAGYRVGTIAEAMTYPTTRDVLAGHTDVWSDDFIVPHKPSPPRSDA